jgi:8-oxo-dGTP pyrophosphatase MutT (NUDIX family)
MSDPHRGEAGDHTKNPWQRIARAVAYENPWIVVYHDEVVRPDGQPGIYGVVHFRNRAVGVVPVDAEDRVLLVGQYRYPLDVYSWEIPEGGAPPGEEPLVCAQRELLEETGYSAERWELVLRAHLSNSVSDEEAFCFLATDLRPGAACPEGTERLQLRWVPFAEALRMVLRGEITDSLSVLGLQRVALLRLGAG